MMPLLTVRTPTVQADTTVGGPIISDTTWTLANSPYIVIASVEVWPGVTLTIEPGVTVKFDSEKKLQVNGELIARGTSSNPITFTSNQFSPAQGDWGNIEFSDGSVNATFDGNGDYTGGNILQYCIVEYGGSDVESAVHAPNAAPYIDHNIMRSNRARGIQATGLAATPVIISNNIVSGNYVYNFAHGTYSDAYGGGIYAYYGTVMGNTVSGNTAVGYDVFGGGIYAYYSTVTDNIVSGNTAWGGGMFGSSYGGGIYASSSTVTSNTIKGNSATGTCEYAYGGGIYASDSTVTSNTVGDNEVEADKDGHGGGVYASGGTVRSNTVSRNSANRGGGVYMSGGTVAGNIVSGNTVTRGYYRYTYGGGIYASGGTVTSNTISGNTATAASRGGAPYAYGGGIYASDSTVTSNTVGDNSAMATGYPYSWASTYAYGGGIYASGGTVTSNTISGNTATATSDYPHGQGTGVYFSGSSDFLYNTIIGNSTESSTAIIGGVAINGTPHFHYNNLYSNSNYDVVVLSSSDISGTNNYWGTVATLDILAHVYDWYDDTSRGRLLYIYPLQDPEPNAPVPPPQNLRANFIDDSAILLWDSIPSTSIGYGYKVYYDTDNPSPPYEGSGLSEGNSPIDVGGQTSYTLTGLDPNKDYYFAVTASDNGGHESWYSNVEQKQATYCISGHIRDGSDNPIPGVTVLAGAGGSATTNASGAYAISNLVTGTYSLTPSKSGWTFTPASRVVSVPPNATGQNFTGNGIDLAVDSVLPVQALENQDLVRDKATAVKVVIHKTGSGAASNVSVRLNHKSSTHTNFYVVETQNMNAEYALIDDNSSYPLSFGADETTKAIYFFSNDFTPTDSAFQVSVMVDYLGTIAETNETNNMTTSRSVPVHETRWSGLLFPDLYIHYFRADWGTTPLSDFDSYYQTSNSFLNGVYPVSKQRFVPSRSMTFVSDTRFYRGTDNRLSSLELGLWVRIALLGMRLAHPTADRFVATVPQNWFFNSTTGILMDAVGVVYPNMRALVVSEARNTVRANGPSIAAHELGHSYGLDLNCEEYDSCNPTRQDGIGNYTSPGLWVDRKIPILVSGSRKIYCFMGAYADREYWIDGDDYSRLLTDHRAGTMGGSSTSSATDQAILVVGTFDITGTVVLDNWYVLPEAELDTLASGPYTFEYQTVEGGLLYQQSFDVSYEFDVGSDVEDSTLSQSPFVFTIPYISGTAKIIVKHNDVSLAEKVVSPNSPTVNSIEPNGGESLAGQATIHWSGSDADGDILSYVVLYSPNAGATWEIVTSDVAETSYTWDISKLVPGTEYLIKVIATDGFNTGQDVSDALLTVQREICLPIILRNH